ncbi:hypothetical protein G6F42_028438 [Rhizopus arrhizus]|nr:hypothetical protein G6F42_028438 [Rhizopus arrhizus]
MVWFNCGFGQSDLSNYSAQVKDQVRQEHLLPLYFPSLRRRVLDLLLRFCLLVRSALAQSCLDRPDLPLHPLQYLTLVPNIRLHRTHARIQESVKRHLAQL